MKFYRALLRLYPASFRAEYGREMSAIFAKRLREAGNGVTGLALRVEAVADVVRNAPPIHWDMVRQDLRYGFRTLRRAPMFTATVMLVSSLGIGATTAAFSVADHVLIKPLPFRAPDRLVKLWQDESYAGYSRNELSPGKYRDWKAHGTSFEGMAAFSTLSANLVGSGEPLRLDGTRVTGDLFSVLGSQAAIGRVITSDDDREGAALTVVLSDRLWRGRFGGDARVMGQTVILNDAPHVVVGVMPPGFDFPSRTVDFWVPFQFEPGDFQDRTDTYLQAVARLRQGISIEQAQSEMHVVAEQVERPYPSDSERTTASVIWLRDEISQQSRLLLLGLVAASVGVLLIACTNLANLFLTRALSRQRELAVRAAIGAGRDRLIRQLFTETLLLAAGGGLAGIALAIMVVPFVARLVPTTLPIADTPAVDARMLAAAALATLTTAIGFGVIPALRVGRHADASALREGARAGTGRRTERLRSALVVAEVTASLVLLVSSGLLVRALWRVQQVDPGFNAENVLTLRTALPTPKYTPTDRRMRFFDRVTQEIRALPGVSHAAYASSLPMVWRGGIWGITVDGRPPDPGATSTASLRQITPGFFAALGIALQRGRDIDERDTATSPAVGVVSASFAREHWPNQDPIGRSFRFGPFPDRAVVGVVGDIRVRGLERNSEPQVYIPASQVPGGQITGYAPKDLVVKSSVPPAMLIAAVRQIVARADPEQPVSEVRMLADIVDGETAPRRVQVSVLGAFAGIAFLLAGIGLHGLLAFNVSSRAREIGVRIALGAERHTILRMVMRQGVVLAGVGVVLGSGLAWAAGRSMQALLFGVSPADATTFVSAVVLVLLMTLVGSLVPALRAIRVDPIAVIRNE